MTEPKPAADATDVDATVEAAVAHHRAGQVEQAERLYAAALAQAPRNWRANHNLAVLYLDRKDPARALPLLAVAMQTESPGAETWLAYARALINTGRFADAEQLIAEHAEHARARGMEIHLRQAWGMSAVRDGAFGEAQAQFRKVLALLPEDADAHGDLGYALLAQGDAPAAESHLRRAAELAPENPGVLRNLGSALHRQGRPEEAAAAYIRAVRLNPADLALARTVGALLNETGAGEDELSLADVIAPNDARLAALIRADGLTNLGRYEESEAILDRLAAATPGDATVLYRRAFVRLLMCDFAGGWADYESRWSMPAFLRDSAPGANQPLTRHLDTRVTRENLAGRRILLVAEQGVGDQIMFASMVPDLARVAGRVTFLAEDRLTGLFRNAFPDVEVLPITDARVGVGGYDKVVALGSLGRAFRNAPAAFPGAPYLAPREEVRRRWAEKLGPRAGRLRIGISWRGGTQKTRAGQRSVSLEQLAPVLDLPGCEFVSVQYGEVTAELASFNAGRAEPIRAFGPAETHDFEELAALVEGLDAVVSIQTAVVHVAGAVGTDCLTLVHHRPEWCYTGRADRMPWYGSVRLFRQPAPNDWQDPIARVADALRRRSV